VTKFGLPSGTYYENSTIYPGTGNFTNCKTVNYAPARLKATNTLKGPGAYASCNATNELRDGQFAKFFYNHPNLKWIPTNSSDYGNIPGILSVGSYSGNSLYVARFNVSYSNGTSYTDIARVWNGSIFYSNPSNQTNEAIFNGNFDILACA
jgi:hypothetical protein